MDIGRPEDYETALRDYQAFPEKFTTSLHQKDEKYLIKP
jgi:hypothetical protein